MKAVMTSFDAGRVSLQLVMQSARNLSESKRRLIQREVLNRQALNRHSCLPTIAPN